jgi:hypothetical protein
MQERGSAVRGPNVLPWRITCNAALDLNCGGPDNGDLDDHARGWLAGSDHSKRHFRSFRVSFSGLQ